MQASTNTLCLHCFFYIYDRNRRAPILYSVQNVTVSDKVLVRQGQALLAKIFRKGHISAVGIAGG
jgi:hypothetical protein